MPNFEKDDKVTPSKSSAASKGSSSVSSAAKTSSSSTTKSSSSAASKGSTSTTSAARTGERAPASTASLLSSSGSGAASKGASKANTAIPSTSLVSSSSTGNSGVRSTAPVSTRRTFEQPVIAAPRGGLGDAFVEQTAERSGQNYRDRYGVMSPGPAPGSFEDWVNTATRGTVGAIAGGLNSVVPPLAGLGRGVLEAAESIDPYGDPRNDPRSTSTLDALMGGYGRGSNDAEQMLAPYMAMDPRLARNAGVIADVGLTAAGLPLGVGGKIAGGLDAAIDAARLPKSSNIVADNLLREIALKRTPEELQALLRVRNANEALDAPISDLLAQRAATDIRELRTNAFEQSGRPTIAAVDNWNSQRYGDAVPDYMPVDDAAAILRGGEVPKAKTPMDVAGPLSRAGAVGAGMGATGLALALWDARQKAGVPQKPAVVPNVPVAESAPDMNDLGRLGPALFDANTGNYVDQLTPEEYRRPRMDPVGSAPGFDEILDFAGITRTDGGGGRPNYYDSDGNPIGLPGGDAIVPEDALNLPGQVEGDLVQPGNRPAIVESNDRARYDELFGADDGSVPQTPVAPAAPWAVPAGMTLAPNGYYYSQDADGRWRQEGKVEGYNASQLYKAANQGAFEDPSSVTARPTAAPRPAPAKRATGEESIFDKIIGFGGTALENTALGGIAKGLFPDMWYGAGEAIKSIDDGTYTGASALGEQDPDWWRSLASERRSDNTTTAPPPPADDDDDDDGTGGTGGTGTLPVYDRNGMVVFPDLPPYNPGRDDEWLYFRKRMAEGGPVNGYADGGKVGYAQRNPMPATAGLDPRLGLIADAEDALSGDLPDPEPVLAAFVEQFGPAALDRLKEQVAKGLRMRGDNARLVRGPGGPKDDAIPARINGREEARLSDGEFVMTAEAVKNAGDGDPRAGADRLMELNDMLARGQRSGQKAPVEVIG